ncbi:hypothetical protein PENSPDRAFT_747630 [Peniophora sp. CONT]|nr:hypothetical protein PENSPDRAFT_747630 [Peniophora sp. CONT]
MANMDMDTDGPPPTPPPVELIDYFDLTPSAFPFRTPKPHEIDTRRAQMSDQLIFDILLSRGGIKQPDTLYPPSDPASLQRLLEAISNSTYDGLKNDCLVYFLLKWHGDGREAGFADELAIPPQFVALTDAYWHLDSGVDVQRAVHLLSDARVNREHSSKIIQALNLTPNHASLVVQFVQVVKPVLVEPPEIEAYGLALVRTDFNAAWAYQRTFAEGSQTREVLLRRIVESCVAPVRQQQVLALYTVPFTPYEQSTIQNIALSPSSSSLPSTAQSILADLLVARLIQAGQLSKAILMDRRLRSAPGVPPASDARKGMIDDALAALPSVEKLVLDDQIAALPSVPPTKKAAPAPTRDVSMSWEEIPPAKSPAVVEKEKPAEKPVSAVPPRKPRTSYGSPAQPVTISGRKSSAFAQNSVPPSPFAPPAASSPKPSAAKPTSSYFGQSTPAPAAPVNENPFASSSKPPANSLFGSTSASASGAAKAPRLSFGTTPLAKSTASTFGASTSKPAPVIAFGSSLKSSVSGFPLNASRAVSASRAPNAFFNPPPPPPELKRPVLEHQDTDDIDAFLAGSAQPSDREISPVLAPAPAPIDVNTFSEPEEEEEPEPQPRPKRKSSAASKIPVAKPPVKTRRSTIKVQHREPPSPSSSPPPRKRTTRARKARMSIPGAFGGGDTDVDDSDHEHGGEEEEEEKDEVAPLPEVPSPVKRRGTRSSVGVGEPIRRSSRLSVASSSPEPVSKSPVKGRRKTTRASGAGEGKKEGGSGSAGRGRGRKR